MKPLEIKNMQDMIGELRMVLALKKRVDAKQAKPADYDAAVIDFIDAIGVYGNALAEKLDDGVNSKDELIRLHEETVFAAADNSLVVRANLTQGEITSFEAMLKHYQSLPLPSKRIYNDPTWLEHAADAMAHQETLLKIDPVQESEKFKQKKTKSRKKILKTLEMHKRGGSAANWVDTELLNRFHEKLEINNPSTLHAPATICNLDSLFDNQQRRVELEALKSSVEKAKSHLAHLFANIPKPALDNTLSLDEIDNVVQASIPGTKVTQAIAELKLAHDTITTALSKEMIRPTIHDTLLKSRAYTYATRWAVVFEIANLDFVAANEVTKLKKKYQDLGGKHKDKLSLFDNTIRELLDKGAEILSPADPSEYINQWGFSLSNFVDSQQQWLTNKVETLKNDCGHHQGFKLILNAILSFFRRLRNNYNNVILTTSEKALNEVADTPAVASKTKVPDLLKHSTFKLNANRSGLDVIDKQPAYKPRMAAKSA